MKRKVVSGADPCPFCGCKKLFLKCTTESVGEKRYALSVQCSSSKCMVHGPTVHTDYVDAHSPKNDHWKILDAMVASENLKQKAIDRWNSRAIVDRSGQI